MKRLLIGLMLVLSAPFSAQAKAPRSPEKNAALFLPLANRASALLVCTHDDKAYLTENGKTIPAPSGYYAGKFNITAGVSPDGTFLLWAGEQFTKDGKRIIFFDDRADEGKGYLAFQSDDLRTLKALPDGTYIDSKNSTFTLNGGRLARGGYCEQLCRVTYDEP